MTFDLKRGFCWRLAKKGIRLGLAICLLMSVMMAVMVSCKARGGGVHPEGFYIADSLSTGNQSMSPVGEGKVFLVVKLEVPGKAFVPTEEEYKKMQAEFAKSGSGYGGGNAANDTIDSPKRDRCRSYRPERFTLILADGRSIECIQMSRGKNEWWASSYRQGGEFDKIESISVAVIVDAKDAKPPFKIKLDNLEPVSVPDKKIEI